MPRYVTVNEITGKVVGVDQVTNASQVGDPPELHRHIFESDWAVTTPPQTPAIDDEWDGQIPTTFTRPAVGELPSTVQEAWDDVKAAEQVVAQKRTVYEQMQGLE
jgi:hypothetical protein